MSSNVTFLTVHESYWQKTRKQIHGDPLIHDHLFTSFWDMIFPFKACMGSSCTSIAQREFLEGPLFGTVFVIGNLCAPTFGLANEHLVRLALFFWGNPKLKEFELHQFCIVLKCFMKKANALAKWKVARVGFCFVWNLRVCPQKFYHRVEMEVCQIIFYLFFPGKGFSGCRRSFFREQNSSLDFVGKCCWFIWFMYPAKTRRVWMIT